MEFRLNRAVNILMIFVWLIAQTLVMSHAQAHGSMNHAAGMGMHHASANTLHLDHQDLAVHHKAGSHDDPAHKTADMPDATDDCCGVPCQSAQVWSFQPFGSELTPVKLNSVHLSSTVSWTPGFLTPPPNPAI